MPVPSSVIPAPAPAPAPRGMIAPIIQSTFVDFFTRYSSVFLELLNYLTLGKRSICIFTQIATITQGTFLAFLTDNLTCF